MSFEILKERKKLIRADDTNREQTGGASIDVNGVIKNVTSRVLPTDSVIVDALLGQGEALDCYNMRLQELAATQASLENDKLQLGIDVINAQTTPTDKADKFNMVFKTWCCPDVNCGCGGTTTP